MTENVLNNIFESLSLDDVAAAETQITEWFEAMQVNEGLKVVPSQQATGKFDVMNDAGRRVGMGMDHESAENFAAQHGKPATIGESEEESEEDSKEESLDEAKDEEAEEAEEAESVDESVNTSRRCGECGEVDAAMDEDAEFCDQCIAEANERNPDMVESIDPAFADLVEQFKGFSVVDKLANKEGAQVGNADSVEVNAKSPVPNIKAAKRVGGSPVEVKAEEHKGFEAEKAPAVKDAKVKNPAPETKRGEYSDKLDNQEGAQVGNADKVDVNVISPIGSKPIK